MKDSAESLEARIQELRCMRRFPPRPEGSEEVPAARYTSPEWFELERGRVFRGPVWLLAGRASRIPEPGDYFTFATGLGGSILVCRNQAGELRAYHNVCLHRGSEIVSGSGRARRFRCPYHLWLYDLDGNLRAVQDERQFHALDKGRHGLRRVRADTFAGWIWVTLDGRTPPLLDYVRDFADEFADYGIDGWEVVDEDSWTFPANWKVIVDAFNEVYHIPQIHPRTVAPFFDLAAALMDTYERHTRMTLPFAFEDAVLTLDPEGGIPVEIPPALDRVRRSADMHYFVFPNVQFNLVPTYATMFAAWPLGLRETRFDYHFLGIGPLDEARRKYYDPIAAAFRVALEEDFANFPRIQRGLDSGVLEGMPLNYQEVRIRHFHRVLSRHVEGA
jgi:phenylpropionate dioxygenase-like ring-hydroxylating dioxygenase large terminal subunit